VVCRAAVRLCATAARTVQPQHCTPPAQGAASGRAGLLQDDATAAAPPADGWDALVTAWCDGQLLRAVETVSPEAREECRQAVMLGPGLDSRPFRRALRRARGAQGGAARAPQRPEPCGRGADRRAACSAQASVAAGHRAV